MQNATRSGFSISRIAIRRHIGTLMLTIALLVLGLFFVTQLSVDLLPSITYPRIGLRVAAPGISPEVAVDEVTRPLEEALSATEGVEQIFSQTRDGRLSIDLYFEPGGNIDQALNDATAALNRARDQLPDTIDTPRLFKFDPSQLPVYEFALTSQTLQGVDLRIFADEELGRELTVVPGVASVDVSGGLQEEVLVKVDLNRLQASSVGLVDLLDQLDARNQDIAGGRIRGDDSESLTRTLGRFQEADEVRDLSFDVGDDTTARQVKLRDFADVIDGTEEQRVFVTLNRQPAVKVSVQKQPDANTITVINAVKRRMEMMRDSGVFPDDLILTVTLDESIFIRDAIRNVAVSGLTGATLAAIAVLLFLGSLRQTFIIVTAIPLATLAAIMMMWLFGLSLNVFTLGGLALGVGIVVDNSIVMLENIASGISTAAQDHANGNGTSDIGNSPSDANGNELIHPPPEALIHQAEQSSQQVESALLASTSTNLVAVIPFLMIGGFISLLFNELILAVSFSIAASLLVALTVVPMLASRLLAIPKSSHIHRWKPLRWFQQRVKSGTSTYARFLDKVLRRRLLTIAIAFVILGGGSVLMIGQIPQEILPEIDTGLAELRVQFPPGTPLADNRTVMTYIDELLMEQPESEYVFTTAGGSLFGSSTSENTLRGRSTITLKPSANVEEFTDRLNQQVNQFNLVDSRIRAYPDSVRGLILNNSPVRGDIDVGLQGSNTETLQQAGLQVLSALDEQASLARYSPDAEEPQTEVQIIPDWERLSFLDLTTADIGNTIQTALLGSVPTQLQRGDRLVDVRVQLDRDAIEQPDQLQSLPLFVDDNKRVRLGDVATIQGGNAPGEIQRINQRQVYLIEGDLNDGANLSQALEEVDQILAGLELPDGVSRLPSYAEASNQQIQSSLIILGGLAAFLVFVVMAVQYNSLIDPLVIILTVPLALAGGIFGLFVTQTALGATVIIGAVLLVGIVVNNAIIMVELANQIRSAEQVNHRTAILLAAPQRLRPILMTTVTTVLGLFPLALGLGDGSEFLQPLGIVVFSGLSLATLLTLIIIPCFYTLLHDLLEPTENKWQRSRLRPHLSTASDEDTIRQRN
ncbi:MAG: efflux RND transporter permease subunit [Elainellaceae cyanobacterium]